MSKSKTYDINETYEIQKSNMPDEFIEPNCIGHIRPNDNYSKDLGFGFDWMRIGDTTIDGRTDVFEDIMGNLYKINPDGTVGELVKDVNQYYVKSKFIFNKRPDMYELLGNEYKLASNAKVFIKDKNKTRYYVPILSLRKSEYNAEIDRLKNNPLFKALDLPSTVYQAGLKLNLEIKTAPHKLYWEIPDEYKTIHTEPKYIPIIITPTNIPTSVGKHQVDFYVQCNVSIPRTIDIKLIAEDKNGKKKLAGAFRIWRNKVKQPKILLVNVKSDIIGKDREYGTKLQSRFEPLIRKYLLPSLVCPQITIEDLDMTSSWIHKDLDRYTSSDPDREKKKLCIKNDAPKNKFETWEVYDHLNKALTDEYDDIYDDYIKIYYINEEAVSYEYDKKASAGAKPGSSRAVYKYNTFYAGSINGMKTILFSNQSDFMEAVSAHEIYHALGLKHTFSNYDTPAKPEDPLNADGKYTYDSFRTDNVMDYRKGGDVYELYSTFWWQWRIVNP